MVMSKVVIGYDPSATAERALEAGVEVAVALGAEIHLVAAFTDRATGGIEITDERRNAERTLAKAAAQIGSTNAQVWQHAIPESPADAIIRVATETGADMIVIGNRGAQGARRVLGSVASAIVGHAPCSVLVVKTT
jgi:nucleotide-binding universal stress UspA family protein